LKEDAPKPAGRPSSLVDTRVIYCGDNLEQLKKLPDACVDLIYIDPPFNSNRNYEVFWGETKEKRAFDDRHEHPRPTLTSCARAASNSPASSKRPAASTTTATGTPPTTSKSCSTRFSGRTISERNRLEADTSHNDAEARTQALGRRARRLLFYSGGEKPRLQPGISNMYPEASTSSYI
jgi:hypothetical protein